MAAPGAKGAPPSGSTGPQTGSGKRPSPFRPETRAFGTHADLLGYGIVDLSRVCQDAQKRSDSCPADKS
jgi:hypothetical protein